MSTYNLCKIFRPESIAVIGASTNSTSIGHLVIKNLIEGGFRGKILPINPKYASVLGMPCFSSVSNATGSIDLAVVCTPANTVPQLVRECGEAGIRGMVILSAGFREIGGEGSILEQAVLAEAQRFEGLRIIGPNCLGVISPGHRLNASFAVSMPLPGPIAFISQSGALCTAVLDWALQEKVGFSSFVSIGNMLDVDFGDLIDYFETDGQTQAIILYVESISDARKFMSAARAFTRHKPIIAYKAGRFAEAAEAAHSHTGSMAGEDAVYQAALDRAGIVRVFEMADLFNCAELLARQSLLTGSSLAIVTNAGGPGIMATDALMQRKGKLAQLSDQTLSRLDKLLPKSWSHRNPVDILGDASPQRFAEAMQIVLADANVHAALVLFTPQAMSTPTETARGLIRVAKLSKKPVLAVWMGGESVVDGIELLNAAGIPTYSTPEQAIAAFVYLVTYARHRDLLYQTPRDIALPAPPNCISSRTQVLRFITDESRTLSESISKTILAAYGIPICATRSAHSVEEAIEAAHELGFPVVMKIESPQVSHKTEVGGVRLNIRNDQEIGDAYRSMVENVRIQRPDAIISGVTVQPMIESAGSRELILGAKRDPVFGMVLMVGVGGVLAELINDRALELPPLTERLARRMLESLRCWPLLNGFRGAALVDVEGLVRTLLQLSQLIVECPEIVELDINPLLALNDSVIALDSRIVVDANGTASARHRYAHLAIHPYPCEYQRKIVLNNGVTISIRPIRQTDEPLWCAMIDQCSVETIHARFNALFRYPSHDLSSQYCFLDYDRELTLVAEFVDTQGFQNLVGAASLITDGNHREAEFAAMVMNSYQSQGLGTQLLRFLLEIASQWRLRYVSAYIDVGNVRMKSLLSKFHFKPISDCDPTAYRLDVIDFSAGN